MRKIVLFIIISICFFNLCYADNISLISGTWNRKTKDVKLFKVENGSLKEIASYQLAKDNKFYFAFKDQREAFYVIGSSLRSSSNNYTFYFKPGDHLNVEINKDSYKLIGENTPENMEMEKWHEFLLPLERKSIYFMGSGSTYVDFFPLLEEKLDAVNSYKVDYNTNQTFNESFKDYRKFSMLHYALNHIITPRSAHPQGEDFPDYYRTVNLSDITSSESLLQYPYGITIVNAYNLIAPKVLADKYTAEQLKEMRTPLTVLNVLLPEITNSEIKGELVLWQSHYLKSYEEFLDFEQKYGKYLITEDQKDRFKDTIKAVASLAQGQEVVNLKFPDINGKDVAMSDLRGKIVYIDIWATWCGPCIKEIPALKKLEEEYQKQDIVFLGINTDVSKDIQKWKDFIKNRNLKGVQVFAGDNAKKDLLDIYKIAGIPRFMLIGKDGKIISADAPRPSSPEIRPLLDASLRKK
ncbi:TlpA family protein disulfide reductase [Dysgonomonas sp. Marseille-P4677]|uniref:TlpA family protein disulfide reductase n=1 Tax=Dysgonomonas sp. Marseille-P4677 TaxID=2364790 RepID=UPI00191453B0|nr:TlpA disulfide reductase family protein [Dysgonomonas sp. Marseille-P4677]MBK5721969.1 TlpA family protein disulfide reductase [Dysgonomonas sp. Marseille-P4677]